MNLQITPFGIVILAIICGAIWFVTAPIRRGLKDSRVGRWFVPAILVAVVSAAIGEEVRIAWQFAKLCEDAGVRVFRKIQVDGYLDEIDRPSSTRVRERLITDRRTVEQVDREGYRFKEWFLTDGRVLHRERVAEGVQWSIRDAAESKYHVRRHYQPTPYKHEEPVAYKIQKIEYQVVVGSTGELLGRRSLYKRFPGFVEALWIRYIGSGLSVCPDPERGPRQPGFPEAVLVPSGEK